MPGTASSPAALEPQIADISAAAARKIPAGVALALSDLTIRRIVLETACFLAEAVVRPGLPEVWVEAADRLHGNGCSPVDYLHLVKAVRAGFRDLRNPAAETYFDAIECRGVARWFPDVEETEKHLRETGERLAHARELEAIGRLTGKIAHDFNNLLTGIIGYASLLKSTLPENGKDRQAAVFIDRSAQRAADLTERLLLHLRRKTPKPRHVDIGKVIGEATGILSRAVRANVEIRTDLQVPPEPVMGDSRELVHALLELGANAADAMPDGGTLKYSTSNFDSDGEVLVDDSPVPEGRYVSISVSDTGTGIPESIRDQVFSLFFTTRAPGDRSGLGLPMVRSCVRAHGGFIDFSSREGKGTTFRVLLPAAGGTTT